MQLLFVVRKVFYRIQSIENKINGSIFVITTTYSQILYGMKTILLLLTVVFTTMAVTGCTNDEGEDIDVLTPDDEQEFFLKETTKSAPND